MPPKPTPESDPAVTTFESETGSSGSEAGHDYTLRPRVFRVIQCRVDEEEETVTLLLMDNFGVPLNITIFDFGLFFATEFRDHQAEIYLPSNWNPQFSECCGEHVHSYWDKTRSTAQFIPLDIDVFKSMCEDIASTPSSEPEPRPFLLLVNFDIMTPERKAKHFLSVEHQYISDGQNEESKYRMISGFPRFLEGQQDSTAAGLFF
ncbi:hypothetical protein FN846DRAFT_1004339 [Sphaerosporella brunnea]|uniref:Uncharacterized protein n=1 Tax=Sphaerosporella brunnea TaxID=1250544 RepID=A0A5J5EF44_9PEZI|nr:hypothetical protein FN846DRAFT_1004339 [Sphaerosporella brunnea]